MVTITPPSDAPINEMYVFVSEDENDNHGVIAGYLGGIATPMVCATERVAEIMKPVAAEIGRRSGMKIKLMHFSNREVLWESNSNHYQRDAMQGGESNVSNGTQPKHSKH